MATVNEPLPANYPITLYRGDTRVWMDEFSDGATGDPIDLSGYTFVAQIRESREASDVLAEMTVDDSEAELGRLTRTLSATDSGALPIGSAFWDLQATRTADGFVRTYLAGRVRVTGDISR